MPAASALVHSYGRCSTLRRSHTAPPAAVQSVLPGVAEKEFIEEAVGLVQDENVAIARAHQGISLDDRRRGRNGHRAWVALATILRVGDGYGCLRAIDDRIGDANGGALVKPGAKVRMEAPTEPMKVMIASELGSTGAFEISSVHGLFGPKGTKPFRSAVWPTDIWEQPEEVCDGRRRRTGRRRRCSRRRRWRCRIHLKTDGQEVLCRDRDSGR